MLNQQDYYFAEQSSLPYVPPGHFLDMEEKLTPSSSTQSSLPVSPQPTLHSHSQPPYYSSPESAAELERKVRMVGSRPRPQCWEHGCNGREFSTFSNLLRHQREKSGAVAKAECPACGAVFTRSTARNIHVAQGKCKGVG